MFQHGLTPQKTGAGTSAHSTPQKTSRLPATPKRSGRITSGGGTSSGTIMSPTPPAKRVAHTQAHADVTSPSRKGWRPLSSARGADGRIRSQVQGQHTVGRPPGATLLPATTHATGIISPPQKVHTTGTKEAHHTIVHRSEKNQNETSSKMIPLVRDRQTLHDIT